MKVVHYLSGQGIKIHFEEGKEGDYDANCIDLHENLVHKLALGLNGQRLWPMMAFIFMGSLKNSNLYGVVILSSC